ncbi:hypothetical protein ACFFRR_004065 [Megaselia abdita]
MVKVIASILLCTAFFALASSTPLVANIILTGKVCAGCPNHQYSERNAFSELDFLLPYLNMSTTEETKYNVLSTYSHLIPEMFCANSTSFCLATPQDYDRTFNELMVKTFRAMGLPYEAITTKLLDSTKRMYDNIAVVSICSADCASVSNTYEDWAAQMGVLFSSLGSQPTNELNEAAINVIQARVVMYKCKLGCKVY